MPGYAIVVATQTAVQIVVRVHYMRRLFAGFRILPHMARAVAPTVPAVAAVLALRLTAGGDRPPVEAFSYLRGRRPREAAAVV